jgi:flavin reductase (DIM6/NTAB) family NADH-FMN oxidoreductase RutF
MNTANVSALFARTDRELWLVTARSGERRGGLVATFVNQASIVPELPRVVAGIARQHYTWELIEASGAFALHLLGEDHLDWVWQFGLRSGREVDKLAGVSCTAAATGSPILTEALGWLDCRVEARLDSGDRTLYLAEVVEAQAVRDGRPLTVQAMVQRASPEQLGKLKKQMIHDAAVDAAAIRLWRGARGAATP